NTSSSGEQMICKWLVVPVLAFLTQPIFAGKCGPGGSCGGDPEAVEFLKLADQISGWLSSTASIPEIDRNDFQAQVKGLRESLDVPNRTARLEFVGHTILCDGIEKPACTTDGKVTVDRLIWLMYLDRQKFDIVTQEILVLMGHYADRYTI